MTLTYVAWAFVYNLKSQVCPEPQNVKEKQLKTRHHALFMYIHELKLMVLRRMPIAVKSGGKINYNFIMKTRFLFLSLFMIFAVHLKADIEHDVAEIERNLKKEQKEFKKLSKKYNDDIKLYQEIVAEKDEVVVKIDSLSKKTNSLAYKKAVKKSEKLSEKQNELSTSIEQGKYQIDSINRIIASYETALQEIEKQQVEGKKEETKETKKSKHKTKETSDEEREKLNAEKESFICVDKSNSQESHSKSTSKKSSSEKDEDDINDVGTWCFLIFLAFVLLMWWFDFKKTHRCPECGKWSLHSEGDTGLKQYGHDGKILKKGARKKYRCSNCGHQVQFIKWF